MILSSTDNKGMQNSKGSFWPNWLYQTLIYILVLLGLLDSSSLMALAVVLAAVYMLFADYSLCVLLLASLSIFEMSFSLFGFAGWIILMLVLVGRILCSKRKLIFSQKMIPIAIVLLFGNAVLSDLSVNGINGKTIGLIVLILFIAVFYTKQVEISVDPESFIIYFGTAYLCAVFYIVQQYGGIDAFISTFMRYHFAFRFGAEYGVETGGAMGIPIYTLLLIAFWVCSKLSPVRRESTAAKCYMDFIAIVSLITGVLTVSRSFILGITVIIVCFLCIKPRNQGEFKRKAIFTVCMIIGIGIICYFARDIIYKTIEVMWRRIENDASSGGGGSGRVESWIAGFQYLLNHPMQLLLGAGALSYVIKGKMLGQAFLAGSHNILVDVLMSWGIVGCACVWVLVYTFVRVKDFKYAVKNAPWAVIPFFALLAFSMTALTTASVKPWLYFLITLTFVKQMEGKGGA